jgi:hypothetical protein
MLLYIFRMRWTKFNIKIYPWITLHIIFHPEKIYGGKNKMLHIRNTIAGRIVTLQHSPLVFIGIRVT